MITVHIVHPVPGQDEVMSLTGYSICVHYSVLGYRGKTITTIKRQTITMYSNKKINSNKKYNNNNNNNNSDN